MFDDEEMTSSQSKGKRKRNFSPDELRILVDAIKKHEYVLHGPGSTRVSKGKKLRIRQSVADKLNVVGVEHRTAGDVCKRWTDLTRRVREKLAAIRSHATGTGGGSPCKIKLTDIEEEVAKVLHPEQTYGLEGVDSGEPQRTSTPTDPKTKDGSIAWGEASSSDGRCFQDNPYVLQSIVSREEDSSEEDEPSGDIAGETICVDLTGIEVDGDMFDVAEEIIAEDHDVYVEDREGTASVPHIDRSKNPQSVEATVHVPHDAPDAPGALQSTTTEPPEAEPNVGKQGAGTKRKVAPRKPSSTNPTVGNVTRTQWDQDLLGHQATQSSKITNMSCTLDAMHKSIDNLSSEMGNNAHGLMDRMDGIKDALLDQASNTCAVVVGTGEIMHALQSMDSKLGSVVKSSRVQANTLTELKECMQEQTTAIRELTEQTRALVEALQASNKMRESQISTTQAEGRHTRMIMRRHARQEVTLHNATSSQLNRIGTAIELLHHQSEVSTSTTPSVSRSTTPNAESGGNGDASTRASRSTRSTHALRSHKKQK